VRLNYELSVHFSGSRFHIADLKGEVTISLSLVSLTSVVSAFIRRHQSKYINAKNGENDFNLIQKVVHVGNIRLGQRRASWGVALHQRGSSGRPNTCLQLLLQMTSMGPCEVLVFTKEHGRSIKEVFLFIAVVLAKPSANIFSLANIDLQPKRIVGVLTAKEIDSRILSFLSLQKGWQGGSRDYDRLSAPVHDFSDYEPRRHSIHKKHPDRPPPNGRGVAGTFCHIDYLA